MKKPAKLLLCKETIRTLSVVQFARVSAGAEPILAGPASDLKHCVTAIVVDMPR
jgi:hypothetical protein